MTTGFETLHPRHNDGKFARKTNSAPTGGLAETDEQIRLESERRGLTGADPTAQQSRLEAHLAGEDRGNRPPRRFLPLQPDDDDEFFDAPGGTIIEIHHPDGKRRYCKGDGSANLPFWMQIDEDGVPAAPFTTNSGEVWAEVFGGDTMASFTGDATKMLPATLHFPDGVTFSDRFYYNDTRR